MQIIVLHPRLRAAKSLTLTNRHLTAIAALFVVLVMMCASLVVFFSLRHAADLKLPFMRELAASSTQDETTKNERYLKENIAAMAVKLGEMQAQLMRLDALGERVRGRAGGGPGGGGFRE